METAQAIEKMKHLRMILKNTSLSTLEDLQREGGVFLAKDLPAKHKSLLPPFYLNNLLKNKDLFEQAKAGAINREAHIDNYSILIFLAWFDHYKTRVEAWDVLIKLIELKKDI